MTLLYFNYYSRVKNKRIRGQISNSNITKTIMIFDYCPHQKFLRILSSLQSFLFETSMVKITKVTNSHFWTILARIGCFFFIFDPPKKCFLAKFTFKNFWIFWSHWYVLNQKLIWNCRNNRNPKIKIFEFTCFNIEFWYLQILKLPFYRVFRHNFAIKKYQWLRRFRKFLGENFSEKFCITHSKLGKGAKSIEIISSGSIIFAYSF